MTHAKLRQRFLEAVAGNDVAAVVACYRDDAVLVAPEGRYEGRDYIEAYYRPQFQAFPDGKLTVVGTHETGDTAIGEWSFAGTHKGPIELPGGTTVAPTGRAVRQRGADVAIVRDGLIAEHRVYYDQLELLEQLGILPALEG
jgi:ketosteroid isomerase-like protein